MTIFYRSRELVINEQEFVPLLSTNRFALHDLRSIHVVRGEPDPLRMAGTPAAAGLLAIIVGVGPLFDSPAAWALAAVALVGTASFGGLTIRARRPRWQLHAQHQGVEVCLYSTTDAQTFGQVRRGLVRALEANHPA
jgi:hypothetical protein